MGDVLGSCKVYKEETSALHRDASRDMACIRHGEDYKKGEVIATQIGHTSHVTVKGQKQPWYLGKKHLRPQKVSSQGKHHLPLLALIHRTCG